MNSSADPNPQGCRPTSYMHKPPDQESDDLNNHDWKAAENEKRVLLAAKQLVVEQEGMQFGKIKLQLHKRAGLITWFEIVSGESFMFSPGNQPGGGERKVLRRYKLRKTD